MDDTESRPNAARVAKRAICMTIVAQRTFLESHAANPQIEQIRERIRDWVTGNGLDAELEDAERAILETPVGKLPQETCVEYSWRFEGAGVLAWAIGQFELPPYDTEINTDALTASLAIASDRASILIESAQLRDSDQLDVFANQMFSYHWRMVNFRLAPPKMDFATFAKEAWFGPLDISHLRLIENDLALRQTTIASAPQEIVDLCSLIAMERHRAANWLIGDHETYSKVDTST